MEESLLNGCRRRLGQMADGNEPEPRTNYWRQVKGVKWVTVEYKTERYIGEQFTNPRLQP